MKKLLFMLSVLFTISFISCSESDEVSTVRDGVENGDYLERTVLKYFIVYDTDKLNSVKVEIYNQSYLHLTAKDFAISGVKNTTLVESIISDDIKNSDSNTANSNSDFNFTDFVLADGVSELKFDLLFDKITDLRGKSAINFEVTGICSSSGIRVAGFVGNPLNCNHTDWEWSYRKVVNNWFDKWVKVYDADSYGSNTPIGYASTSIVAPKYKLRVDPNSNCNSYSSFSFIFTSIGC